MTASISSQSMSDVTSHRSAERQRKTVSFSEEASPLDAPAPRIPPSYKTQPPPAPRASSLVKHTRQNSVNSTDAAIKPRKAPPALTVFDAMAVASQPPACSATTNRSQSTPTVATHPTSASLSTPPQDSPVSLPLPLPASAYFDCPPSPATTVSSFLSDAAFPASPAYTRIAFSDPFIATSRPAKSFAPSFSLSLLFICALCTLVQEADNVASGLFHWLDIAAFYAMYCAALCVFGSGWLLAWTTPIFIIVALDITTMRERHLALHDNLGVELEIKLPPHYIGDREGTASDGDDDPTFTVDALVTPSLPAKAPWESTPFLAMTGSIFVLCFALLAAALVHGTRRIAWFNLSLGFAWLLSRIWLDGHLPSTDLSPDFFARRARGEAIALRQARDRLAIPALLYVARLVCTFFG